METLFRPEALLRQRTRHFGTVFINTPVHYGILSVGLMSLLCFFVLFFILAAFSEKYVVKGYLNSTKGIVRVFPNRNGFVKKRMIHQGQHVNVGEALFLIDTSSKGYSVGKKSGILHQLSYKKQVLEKEILYKKNELEQLKGLVDKGFLSKSDYHLKQQALMVMSNQRRAVEMEIIQYHESQAYVVRAPITGVVSSVMVHQGQSISVSKPLAKLLPEHSQFIAELFVPVRHAGFLKKNDPVVIQYDAYSSSRFGTTKAMIQEISQIILTDEEDEKPFLLGEPYYKVTATLAKQSIMAYGKAQPLQYGMTLMGVVIGPKKKLWQWVLDPIYRYYGNVVL